MKDKCLFFLLLFFLIFPTNFLFSSGNKDEEFLDIDEKIQEKQYNDALLLLNTYIKENPENFDNAQKRVNEIMDVRSRYAKLAEEIIYVIINEPTNDEKKLKMIAELEAIEENPSESTREFIAQTKAAAEFTYYRSKFEEIIFKGSVETTNKEYISSLRTNFSGFELYRSHFHQSGYEKSFVDSVEKKISDIEDMINSYDTLKTQLDISYENLVLALEEGNVTKSLENYSVFENRMKDYATLRNTIVEAGWYFRDSFYELQKIDSDLTEASFLAFAYRFVLGRASTANCGMINALDNLWNSYTEGLKPYITTQIAKKIENNNFELSEKSMDFFANKNKICGKILQEADSFVDIGIGLVNLQGLIKTSPESYFSTENTDEMLELKQTKSMIANYNLMFRDILSYKNCEISLNQFDILDKPEKQVSAFDFSYKDFIFDLNNKIKILENNSNEVLSSLTFSYENISWKKSFDLLKEMTEFAKAQYISFYSQNVNNLSAWCVTASKSITEEHLSVYNQCYEMLNESLSHEILSYPTELQPIISDRLVQISSDIKALEVLTTFYDEDLASVSTEKKSIESDISSLASLLEKGNVLISKARERVNLSELAKNEADLRYNQAENALNNGDYSLCRDYIDKARAKYNESLLYQESETLRKDSDAMLLALGERIIRGENEIVVKEVRDLKTRAKNAYYAGNFETAENLLSQAKIRWASTNSETDIEIESLLSLVGNALSLKTGRTIAPTAPLYPEMSQLLNIANQYYNEGKSLLASGKTRDAKKSFESAKQKLREVQTVYPLNQEASLLTLRIDKLIDEKAFTEYFTRKVENAKSEYLDKSKQQTVYAELLDLYEINPSYPGLKDFIYNVEIALGIRVKPPDTSALRRSTQLTAEAKKVYEADSRNEISLNSALQLINQALEANPDNTEAQILKDRISTSLGGTGTAVLPANAEKLYQQAVQELQKGNTLQAYAIVSGLMENKTYSKSSKIIDLMKKVESLL